MVILPKPVYVDPGRKVKLKATGFEVSNSKYSSYFNSFKESEEENFLKQSFI